MRILESCTSTWPVPDMQARIDALREAFSADTSRPFELKPSFPYGSPTSSAGLQPSPPPEDHLAHHMLPRQESLGQSHQLTYNPQPITPPVSAGFDASKGNSLSSVSMPMMSNGQQQQLPLQTSSMGNDQVEWNPTPIFKYVSTLIDSNSEDAHIWQFMEHRVRNTICCYGSGNNVDATTIISRSLSAFIPFNSSCSFSSTTAILSRSNIFSCSRDSLPL